MDRRLSERRFEQLRIVFERALQLQPDERIAFITTACGEDSELYEQVASLLTAHDASTGYLERLADQLVVPALRAFASGHDDELAAIGRQLSHYEVIERIGGGGMGVVYKARDVRLGRTVALKFLPPRRAQDPAARAQLLAEAQAASALDHPNIAVVYEIGETETQRAFIAMAWYEGETLKERLRSGPLPVEDAIATTAQIADALAAAHQAGIIHRDIKPANVLITRSGTAKLVDFGIAKLVSPEGADQHVTAGTPAYMSPEQTRGMAVDARTDLWSLGVVLYEMLAGRRPFGGENDQLVMAAIRDEEPVPITAVRPEIPPVLGEVVARCLRKMPAERYSSAEECLAAIRACSDDAPRTAAEWRTDRRSRPMSRRSRFLVVGASLAAIGAASAIAWGVAQRSRVASDGRAALFSTESRAAHRPPTADMEAYELYLKGRFSWSQRTGPKLEEALAYYRGAIERDPEFALAYSGMAEAYVNMSNFGYMASEEALARAEVAVARAIALDSSIVEAHSIRGFVLASRGAFADSEASLRRAIQLNPSYSWAHHYYALLLIMLGRYDEAANAIERSLALDPLSLPANSTLGVLDCARGNYANARAQLQRTVALSPEFQLSLYYLGVVEAREGRYAEAVDALERAYAAAPGFPGTGAGLAYSYLRLGRPADARRITDDLRDRAGIQRGAVRDERSRLNLALGMAVLGNADSAFAMLQTARWDVPTLIELRANPLLEDFRADSRYAALLQRTGLEL
jgi:eukaryotic-like serine/threonine-protein kinase